MNCYNCQTKLGERDICLGCGADVRLYKKIFIASNQYYDIGLEKARERDLTGAVAALQESLRFDRHNSKARNLLGLVYYQLGEVGLAVRAWEESRTLEGHDPVALYFLKSTRGEMDSHVGMLKRYNRAVHYVEEKSYDLAFLELKRIVSKRVCINKARQMYALLLMQQNMFHRAEKVLQDCLEIDRGDALTQYYLDELTRMKKRNRDSLTEAVKEVQDTYTREDDVLIPVRQREFSHYGVYLLYLFGGILLGAGVIFFLYAPAMKTAVLKEQADSLSRTEERVSTLQADLAEKEASITTLEGEKADLEDTISTLEEKLDDLDGTREGIALSEPFFDILEAYTRNDLAEVVSLFEALDPDVDDSLYQELYLAVQSDYANNMFDRCFYEGISALENQDYAYANELFRICYELEPEDEGTCYYLGFSYEGMGTVRLARQYYERTIELDENSTWGQMAQERLEGLSG